MLRPETKTRARALQLLYAWELHGRPPMHAVAEPVLRRYPQCRSVLGRAESLASAVASDVAHLDQDIADAAENWRLERIGAVERNILRLGVYELSKAEVPPRVAINEAVRLAHWFVDSRAAPFVNGVLDTLARRAGRL